VHVRASGPYLAWVELLAIPAPRQHVVALETLRNLDLIGNIEVERSVAFWGAKHRWLELCAQGATGGRALGEPHTERDRILSPHRPCRESSIRRAHRRDHQVLLKTAVIDLRAVSNEV